MTDPEFTLRLTVAFAVGTLIGFERQWRQRMAGLRTNVLVATGACLFVLATPLSGDHGAPTRVTAQVVSGIGFLAGAVIFREGLSVRGLNTAATLWCSAAVGTLAGLGYLIETAIGSAFVLAANILLRPVSQAINRRSAAGTELTGIYEIALTGDGDREAALRWLLIETLRSQGLRPEALSSEDVDDSGQVKVEALVLGGRDDAKLETAAALLQRDAAVRGVSWKAVALDEESHLAAAGAE
jgi:putative Mg2+ transporter-C (MgtC) family protein